jgi:integrase
MAKTKGARPWGNIRKLASGNYQIRYTDQYGRAQTGRVTFTKKILAQQELDNIRLAIQKNTWSVDYQSNESPAQLKLMTLTELGERWRAQATYKNQPLKPKTLFHYKGYVESALKDLANKALIDLTPVAITNWRSQDLKREKFKYTEKVFKHLRQLLTWAVDQGYLPSNPTDKIKGATGSRPRQKKIPSVEQVALMLANCPSPEFKLQLALIALLGLRPEEIYELRRKDLTKAKNKDGQAVYLVSITRAISWLNANEFLIVDPKGEGAGFRTLETPEQLAPLVREHLLKVDLNPEALLFPNGADPLEHKPAQNYRYQWNKLRKLSGYTGAFYTLRAWANTELVKAGANEAERQHFLGHTSLEVNMAYLVNDGTNQTKLMNNMPKVI